MRYIKTRGLLGIAALIIADILFFGTTDPSKVASVWLVVAFLLAIVNIYWFSRGLVAILAFYIKPIAKQKRRLTRAITLSGSLLIGMQSIGQLSFRDLIILLPLTLIAYFYFSYARGKELRAQ